MEISRANKIASLVAQPAWSGVVEELREQAAEARGTLLDIMAKRPDTLTGKKAISLAVKVRTLEDLEESFKEAVQLSTPQPEMAGNNGRSTT